MPAHMHIPDRFVPHALFPHHSAHDVLRTLTARYDIVTRRIDIDGDTYALHAVKDTNRLVDAIDPASFAGDERFPYWAELWPSALELVRLLRADPELPGTSVLELGCGLGLAGIAAVKAGARVTMTDYEEDALLFARANALANLTADELTRLTVSALDWRTPPADARYDRVIASDIVYERRNFAPILALLRAVLAPGGYAVLTEPDRQVGAEFFAQAFAEGFAVSLGKVHRVTDDGTITVTCARLAPPRRGQP